MAEEKPSNIEPLEVESAAPPADIVDRAIDALEGPTPAVLRTATYYKGAKAVVGAAAELPVVGGVVGGVERGLDTALGAVGAPGVRDLSDATEAQLDKVDRMLEDARHTGLEAVRSGKNSAKETAAGGVQAVTDRTAQGVQAVTTVAGTAAEKVTEAVRPIIDRVAGAKGGDDDQSGEKD